MTLDTKRKQLEEVMRKIPEFKKSTRGEWLYNAKDYTGCKLKVQFKGYNFKVFAGGLNVLIFSKPISKVSINGVEKLLNALLKKNEEIKT